MADIYGSHFEYGGISSRRYGLIIASVETGRMIQSAGTITGTTIFSKNSNKQYLIDDDYSGSPLSFDIEIVTDNERVIKPHERREIEKWLFNKHDYRRLYIDITDDDAGETYELIDGVQKRLYLNCRFVNPVKLEYNGGIVGYKSTIETDCGMFWQDSVIKKYNLNHASQSSSSVITVNVDTDLEDFIYPKVIITMGSMGGDIIIANNSDDSTRLTKFLGLSASASVIMKGELNYISGQYYEKFYKQNFIRLVDGDNKITVMGNVSAIEFEFSNRRAF